MKITVYGCRGNEPAVLLGTAKSTIDHRGVPIRAIRQLAVRFMPQWMPEELIFENEDFEAFEYFRQDEETFIRHMTYK